MSLSVETLSRPPIVEAVLDIDCGMPATFDLSAIESQVKQAFESRYPKFRPQFLDEHIIEHKEAEPPRTQFRRALQSLRCLQDDEKQLVQIRTQGFSFNRLAPYTKLDDYLEEIRRTWEIFVGFAHPVQIRAVRLRYINRLMIPLDAGKADLDEYFNVSPKLPDEDRLVLVGFLHQHEAREKSTGHHATIVLASQPVVAGVIPVIFDIVVTATFPRSVESWENIMIALQSLRDLKNGIFESTLTAKCLNLYRAP